MSISEITEKVNQIHSAWEQLKSTNDKAILEKKHHNNVDPITLNQIEKLNNIIDEAQYKLSKIDNALTRPESNFAPEVHGHTEHKQAFNSYLRKGIETGLQDIEHKALSVHNDKDGGYFVTPEMSSSVITKITNSSPMRQICKVTSISTDTLEIIEDTDEAFAGWTQEIDLRDETETPQINKRTIQVHELYAQPKATQKLIDDASIDIESWLTDKLVDVFARKENAAFISGDGIGKPRGILTYNHGKAWGAIEQIHSSEGANVTADSIIKLYYSLKEIYAVKAKFLMSRATVQAIRMLKDTTNGKYLWQPSFNAGSPDTLLGAEVIQCPDMPGLTQDALSIAFADFKSAYQIVDRQSLKVLRDPYTEKPFIKFYTTKRVGGDVINFDAIKLLKLSA
jgi:HK97 family phage major capsid protein